MKPLKSGHVNFYKENGFLLVKNVFSKEEVDEIRGYVQSLSKNELQGDLSQDQYLSKILADERLSTIAKSLLGESIFFYGKSNIFYEVTKKTGNFHHDAKLTNDDRKNEQFPIIRLGIFLQDHSRHSGGIKFRRGSHKYKIVPGRGFKYFISSFKILLNTLKGKDSARNYRWLERPSFSLSPLTKSVNVPSEVGDLTIFNMRTYHCGRFVRLKVFPNIVLPPILERVLPSFVCVPREKDRYALFINYASDFSRFREYLYYRAIGADFGQFSNSKIDDPSFENMMSQAGITIEPYAKNVAIKHDAIDKQE